MSVGIPVAVALGWLAVASAPAARHAPPARSSAGKNTAAMVATAPAPFAWPTPDLIEDAPVSGPMTAQGIPVRLRAVKLKHTIDELAPLYYAAYRKAGFYVPPREHQFDMFRDPALTAFDPAHFISYTALFQKNPDGTTTVILGEANLGQARRTDVPPGFPMPAEAGKVSRFEMEGTELLSYDVPLTAPEVESFYKDALAKRGFTPGETSPETPSRVFRKGATELEVTASAKGHTTGVVVLIRHSAAAASASATASAAQPDSNAPQAQAK